MAPSRAPYVCASCARSIRSEPSSKVARTFTTSARVQQQQPPNPPRDQLPRWQTRPAEMRMPVRIRPMPNQPMWKVNNKPEPLDEMYDVFIGKAGEAAKGQDVSSTRGRDLLPDVIKWLAVTHRSYEHGAIGFNDRLAFLGKRILELQTSLALLNGPSGPAPVPSSKHVFKHPALEGVENISTLSRHSVLAPSRLAQLATSYGMDKVIRWKPRKSDNLQSSGVNTVLAHTVYSIIGALALIRGGEVATRTAKERVLQPLGLR